MTTSVTYSTGASAGVDHGGVGADLPDTARQALKDAAEQAVTALATVLDTEFDGVTTQAQIITALRVELGGS